jgi:hypothetical protein
MIKAAKGKGIDPHGAFLEPLWNLSARLLSLFTGLETEMKSLSACCVVGAQGLEPWAR